MRTLRHPAFIVLFLSGLLTACDTSGDGARQVVVNAADAMGGENSLQSLNTLQIFGYGQEAYQDGGSLITTEPSAPEKMTSMTAYNRVIDLANNRTRVQARFYRAFVFAAEAMMKGAPVNQSLDGTVAYDLAGNGTARRVSEEAAMTRRYDMLAIAPVAVRAALDSSSTVSNRRQQDDLTLVDVSTEDGMNFTLAVNNDSGLPAWMRWLEPHENLGEITQRAEYSAWLPVDGILLPMSINTVSDWKDTVMLRLNIDRYIVNASIDNLAAPAAVRNAPAPVQTYTVNAEPVANHVWLMAGNNGANSVLLEFSDHLTLFELPTNRAWSRAVIDKARTTVPGKPITQVIISHHHFDHTGGLREAIADGITLVAHPGNMEWFEELAQRKVTTYHDKLSRNPRPVSTLSVEDHLQLSDDLLTVDVYHTISNGHMAHGLFAYIPEYRLMIQGDLFDRNWEVYFWGNTYDDNVSYRNLEVERDVPIHGTVTPIDEVHRLLSAQKANAKALCDRVDAAGMSMPGCPLAWDE
jgi:glyoxylase-like metal-dependent hydrolase (beta-lactamase superfamily II)